jgi:hypothetical protein
MIYCRDDLTWRGDTLRLGSRELACLVPDGKWPSMWRVRLPGGRLSDMANKTWAKEGAYALALRILHSNQGHQETPSGASPMRFDGEEAA